MGFEGWRRSLLTTAVDETEGKKKIVSLYVNLTEEASHSWWSEQLQTQCQLRQYPTTVQAATLETTVTTMRERKGFSSNDILKLLQECTTPNKPLVATVLAWLLVKDQTGLQPEGGVEEHHRPDPLDSDGQWMDLSLVSLTRWKLYKQISDFSSFYFVK